jgi:nucleoside 2-deoxyribosyltransferase
MKVYVAAPWVHKDYAKSVRDQLVAAGIECTSRWVDFKEDKPTGGMSYNNETLVREAQNDFDDVKAADALLLLNLQSRGNETSGKAVETGLALAWGKKVVMVGDPSNVFHYLPQVTRVQTVEEAIQCLKP